jgi:hypothetical protein
MSHNLSDKATKPPEMFCGVCYQSKDFLILIKEIEKNEIISRGVCSDCFKKIYLHIPEEIEIKLIGRLVD